MNCDARLLWISDKPAPAHLSEALARWDVQPCLPGSPLPSEPPATVAVVCLNGQSGDLARVARLVLELERTCVLSIFLLPPSAEATRRMLAGRGPFLCVDEHAAGERLASHLSAVAELSPALRGLQSQLAAARAIGTALPTDGPRELDEQMRLAARLQRDFLPRRLPRVGPARFGVYYRPASWVSGDIYDVARLDETHLGFYVADAVGHGMPAALLTMFIKKALQTKRIVGNAYEIIAPHEALSALNTDICEQNLSGCQFCTAVYAVLDTSTLCLTHSRAGHPQGLLLRRGEPVAKLACPGSLLGVFPQEQYESRQAQLQPGDRVVLFTDGAEAAVRQTHDGPPVEELAAAWSDMQGDELLTWVSQRVENAPRPPDDDVTLLVMDIQDD